MLIELAQHLAHGVGLYLCYYNAGGFSFNTHQLREYLTARTEVWAAASTKTK